MKIDDRKTFGWRKGQIPKVHPFCSYDVKLENQSVYGRNSKHIRATSESITFDEDGDIVQVPEIVPAAARKIIPPPAEATPNDVEAVQQWNPIVPHVALPAPSTNDDALPSVRIKTR